jgi:hypothetical protein
MSGRPGALATRSGDEPGVPAGYPAGLYRNRMRLAPASRRHGSGSKVIGVANAGRPARVGVGLADTRHHLHVLGPTGTGKSTLLLRLALDDAAAGRGLAVFDPKGDLVRDILDRLPAECANRLILIDPDETVAPPALNLLDPVHAGGSPHDVAAGVTAVMGQVWSRWWGHRTADIAHHALLTLAHIPGSTLADVPRLLSDTTWRAGIVAAVTAQARAADPWQSRTLTEFWQAFDQAGESGRSAAVAPLLAKLRLVLAHPLAASLFGVPASTFRLADVLRGAILLVRLPKGQVGEETTRLVGSLLLAGLWQATTARARVPEHRRLDASITVDECHNFLHLPIGLDDALAEARGLRVSFVLAHQYLGQLPEAMFDAIDANARNKVYFALAPGDARRLRHHVAPYLDDGDLARQGGFEVTLRAVAGGRALPPVTADTLPPPRPQPGRAALLRAAARDLAGLDRAQRDVLLAGTAVAANTSSTVDIDPGGPGAYRPAHSVAHQVTRGTATPRATGRATPNPANTHVNGVEQERP